MADLGGVFNAEDVAPLGDRSPVPAGSYRACIVKSEWKDTKSGSGRYLELTIQIVDGEHKGRMVWSRLNLENPNSQAVGIARSELSSICRAVGKLTPRDTAELHDVPFIVEVSVKKRADNGEPNNEVKGYKSVAVASQSQAEPASAGTSGEKPGWL